MPSPLSSTYLADKIIHKYAPFGYQNLGTANYANLFSLNGVLMTTPLGAFSDGIYKIPKKAETYKLCEIQFKQQVYWRIALNPAGFVLVSIPAGHLNSFAGVPGSEYIQIDGSPYAAPIVGEYDTHFFSPEIDTVDLSKPIMYRGGTNAAYNITSWPPSGINNHVIQIFLSLTIVLHK